MGPDLRPQQGADRPQSGRSKARHGPLASRAAPARDHDSMTMNGGQECPPLLRVVRRAAPNSAALALFLHVETNRASGRQSHLAVLSLQFLRLLKEPP